MVDKVAERLKYKTEVLRLLVVLTVAIGGGSLSLLLGTLTMFRAGLATAGILVTLVLFRVAWKHHRQIEALIEDLPEDL